MLYVVDPITDSRSQELVEQKSGNNNRGFIEKTIDIDRSWKIFPCIVVKLLQFSLFWQ